VVVDTILRFLIGGLVVSVFAILGDMIKPESLGGVFAAAPTIAFATLSLTLHKHGAAYIAIEARSMVAGAIAFFIYACCVSFTLVRWRPKSLTATITLMPVWFATAAALWALWLRR
jgi:predicted signal transduction protein with EAL and GGDEF domain